MRLLLYPFLALCLYCNSALAQPNFQREIERIFAQNSAHLLSGLVQNSSGTHTYFFWNKDQQRMPASNQKLLTSATAYHLFGENHSFDTEVYFSGTFANGVLSGDVIIYGRSDYTMHDEYGGRALAFEALKEDLIGAGLTRVRGNVIAMGDFLIQKNDGLANAATQFFDQLTKRGQRITVEGSPRAGGRTDPPGTLMAAHSSMPLKEALKTINKRSDNNYAETLLVHLGLMERNQVSFTAGASVVKDYLSSFGATTTVVADGSGLSRSNQVSPDAVIRVIRHMYLNPATKSWVNTLSIAGTDGTLASRLRGADTRGYVRAKTGTLRDVVALSGVLQNRHNNHTYFFSFLMNNVQNLSEARTTIDRAIALLAGNFQDPIPDRIQQTSSLAFASPQGSSPRTAQLSVQAGPEINSVYYFADNRWLVGSSEDSQSGFAATYRFQTPGDRRLVAYGYNNRQELVALAEITVMIRDEDADLRFDESLTQSAPDVANPVSLMVQASPGIASVTYVADDRYELETVANPSNKFLLTYEFLTLGERKITAVGKDASGVEVARSSIQLNVYNPTVSTLDLSDIGEVINNPVNLRAKASPDIVRVVYTAEEQWQLGESFERDGDFAATYPFSTLGRREIVAYGYREGATSPAVTARRTVQVVDPNVRVNKLGAWIWRIEQTGYTHSTLAQKLARVGVKRVYLKLADGSASCSRWPDLCNPAIPAIYKAQGVEPYGWSYNYPRLFEAQGDALYLAAKSGYLGFVVDVEVEFDGKSTELHNLFAAFRDARSQAVREGVATSAFRLNATTWSNPRAHRMRVDIIDQYVDAHMPQTYVELFGAVARANPEQRVNQSTCEYRELGTIKPVNHIVSTEKNIITAEQINRFIGASGPETSIWRVPGGEVSQAIWDDWTGVQWNRTDLTPAVCRGTTTTLTSMRSRQARRQALKRTRIQEQRIRREQIQRNSRLKKLERTFESAPPAERWQRYRP